MILVKIYTPYIFFYTEYVVQIHGCIFVYLVCSISSRQCHCIAFQLHITRWKGCARLGFMHMCATNWCIWVRILVFETLESFLHHSSSSEHHQTGASHTNSSADSAVHHSHASDTSTGPYDAPNKNTGSHTDACPLFVDTLLVNAAPYLFPCVLEYSLLAAAIMYSMYTDIDQMNSTKDLREHIQRGRSSLEPSRSANTSTSRQSCESTNNHNSHSTLYSTHVNFDKTHRGLFLGLVLSACAAVSILIFFSYKGDDGQVHLYLYYISDNVLQVVLLIFVMIGWLRIQRLNIVASHNGLNVDQTILILAMTGVVLFHMFKITANLHVMVSDKFDSDHNTEVDALNLMASILAVIVCVTQSCFIVNSMSAHSTTSAQLMHKPGRGCITLLLFANVSCWLFKTFLVKQIQKESTFEVDVYGYLATQLIRNTFTPLMLFYYYHSSACLAEVWSHAYTHGSGSTASSVEDSLDLSTTISSPPTTPVNVIRFDRRPFIPNAQQKH